MAIHLAVAKARAVRSVMSALVVFALAISVWSFVDVARAQVSAPPASQPQGSMAMFGMIGIVAGQTARLNVVLSNPPGYDTPCDVDLAFFDATGNSLGAATAHLDPGQAAYLDYGIARGGNVRPGPGLGRIQIRATAKAGVGPSPFFPPRPVAANPCEAPVLATLEVLDSQTLQSTLVLNPAVLVGFNPQPDPPVGIP